MYIYIYIGTLIVASIIIASRPDNRTKDTHLADKYRIFRRKAGLMYAALLPLCCKGLIYGTVSVASVMPMKMNKRLLFMNR